jgi:mediator of RNA polymerase II transcription subunit 5
MFRTQTLAAFEPVDKHREDEDAQVYEVYDQTLGLEDFQVRELPTENTRAGLYIYLNAAVSAVNPSTNSTEPLLTSISLLAGH